MFHHTIVGKTVSQTVAESFEAILNDGHHQESRNGGATALYNTNLVVTNPRCRHLSLNGRTSNIFQLIAETFWVMAGANAVRPYLEFFLPRAANYSDDGEAWHGAYGSRMYMYNQIDDAVKLLAADKFSRRAVIQIAMPELDSKPAIEGLYGKGHSPKDLPCNREAHAYVTPDNEFHLKLIQRSGDAIFGAGSINPFEFTFIQELMYNQLKKSHPELKLGYYTWSVTNYHLYDSTRQQAIDVLESPQCLYFDYMELMGPDFEDNPAFFGELLSLYSYMITCDMPSTNVYTECMDEINKVFCAHGVPAQRNLMFEYAQVLVMYILSKRGFTLPVSYYGCGLSNEYLSAIVNSKFREFSVFLGIEWSRP